MTEEQPSQASEELTPQLPTAEQILPSTVLEKLDALSHGQYPNIDWIREVNSIQDRLSSLPDRDGEEASELNSRKEELYKQIKPAFEKMLERFRDPVEAQKIIDMLDGNDPILQGDLQLIKGSANRNGNGASGHESDVDGVPAFLRRYEANGHTVASSETPDSDAPDLSPAATLAPPPYGGESVLPPVFLKPRSNEGKSMEAIKTGLELQIGDYNEFLHSELPAHEKARIRGGYRQQIEESFEELKQLKYIKNNEMFMELIISIADKELQDILVTRYQLDEREWEKYVRRQEKQLGIPVTEAEEDEVEGDQGEQKLHNKLIESLKEKWGAALDRLNGRKEERTRRMIKINLLNPYLEKHPPFLKKMLKPLIDWLNAEDVAEEGRRQLRAQLNVNDEKTDVPELTLAPEEQGSAEPVDREQLPEEDSAPAVTGDETVAKEPDYQFEAGRLVIVLDNGEKLVLTEGKHELPFQEDEKTVFRQSLMLGAEKLDEGGLSDDTRVKLYISNLETGEPGYIIDTLGELKRKFSEKA